MPRWTEEQSRAIEARNSNLLVAAAAGSGKTAVLVERIIQLLIKDEVDIDRLLIVTFTNAAAGEMRERIAAALLSAMEQADDREEQLRRQVNLLGKASISTLHSFCISVLRKYFYTLDLDPNFRIGDETETGILKMEAMEELFESEYQKGDETFLGLVERFGGNRQDIPLQDLVFKLHGFIQSKPYPGEWLAERVEDFMLDAESFSKSPWAESLAEQIRIELSGAREMLMRALSCCRKPGGPSTYEENISLDLAQINELTGALDRGLTLFYDQLQRVEHKRLNRCPKDVDETLKAQVQGLRDDAKDILKGIRQGILSADPEDSIRELKELYPYMKYLYELVMAFDESYKTLKNEKGIIDFNDLEHYTLSILQKEGVAEEYRSKYQYIFVDEYQDSNLVQETILGFIRKENNLFMVGDVKQSIYRFRLADPSLFIEKYNSYRLEDGEVNRRIDLNRNFRSRRQILQGVNCIFSHIMSSGLGELDYDDKACLYPGLEIEEIEDPRVELDLIEKDAELSDVDPVLEEMDDIEIEARITAGRIKELLNSRIYDAKLQDYRDVEYRDIVVLLRSTKGWAPAFLETFMAEGIPSYADVNTGYFEVLEVQIFMNLLKIIDNKRQDIPLLSVMRSPIGGFGVEDLIAIRMEGNGKSFFEAAESYIQKEDGELARRLAEFFERLDEWKKASRYMDIDEFIWKLYMDTGYYYYVASMPGGIERQANLRILHDRARQFEKTSIKGLFNFIRFIDKLQSSSGDMGTAKTLGENDNVVRIMSIHKSKGLEFPVVIVAGMGKQFNLTDTNAQVLFHKDLGVGPRYVDPDLRQTNDTLARMAMKHRIRVESLSEEMRILYVALTRPKDKLIMIGSIRGLQSAIAKWAGSMDAYALSRGKSYLDWIGPVLLRHPDGQNLREAAGMTVEEDFFLDDPSEWNVRLIDKSHVSMESIRADQAEQELAEQLRDFHLETAAEIGPQLQERLLWKYPHQEAVAIPSKFTVTEIKKLSSEPGKYINMDAPSLIEKPRFLEGKKRMTGAERGTVIHFVMQHLDLSRVFSREEIEEQVKEMVEKELLLEDEAQVVDIPRIMEFFQSPVGQRVLKAEQVWREVPFHLVMEAGQVLTELQDAQEKILIQGVIDCYFEEEGEWVLVDYKSDYCAPGQQREMAEKYRMQIQLYAQALEKITGKRVKERILYLFYLKEAIFLP